MNKRFAFLLTFLILVPLILAACGGGDDEGDDGLTNDSATDAFNALLAGDPEPAQALSCEEVQGETEQVAAIFAELTGEEGTDAVASCEVGDDRVSCDVTFTVEVEGQDPVESVEPFAFEIADGKICQRIDE